MLITICFSLVGFAEDDNSSSADPKACAAAMQVGNTDAPAAKATRASNKKKPVETAKSAGLSSDFVRKSSTQYTLNSFFAEPENNIAVKHPATVVTSSQLLAAFINHIPSYNAIDPLYGVDKVRIYPSFHGESPHTGNKFMIGQYAAIKELVDFINNGASGSREGKAPLFLGPGGTGKTELVLILTMLANSIVKESDVFKRFTFEWINTDKIPGLKPLTASFRGENLVSSVSEDMRRSPFVLLRSDIQQDVMQQFSQDIANTLGFAPIPWTNANPKMEKIIEAIFEHEYPQIRSREYSIDDLSKEAYMNTLSKYVRIVEIKPAKEDAAISIVRSMPENPKYDQLFTRQNLSRMMYYQTDNALLYDLTGQVLQTDGLAMVLDELFRNDPGLLDILLEVIQNGVVATDVGPAIRMNVVPVMTSNDESMDRAKENAALKAFIDRLIIIPTRWNLHPREIEKAIVALHGLDTFKMRKLSEPHAKFTSIKINEVFPLPTNERNKALEGANGRYVLSTTHLGKEIIIAPHALELMGLATAATRFVTDAKQMDKYASSLNHLSAHRQFYSNVKSRLDLILRKASAPNAVLKDLNKVRTLLREGEKGISSRSTKRWFEKALAIAVEEGTGVLTPLMVERAFEELMNGSELDAGELNLRNKILQNFSIVRDQMIIPDILKDVQTIVSGDGDRAARTYDSLVQDLIAKAQLQKAGSSTEDGSFHAGIDEKRIEAVSRKYYEIHGRQFEVNFLLRFIDSSASNSIGSLRDPELLEAVQAYLTEGATSIADDIDMLTEYYRRGQNGDPRMERIAQEAEARIDQLGYTQNSFASALYMLQKFNLEQRNKLKAN